MGSAFQVMQHQDRLVITAPPSSLFASPAMLAVYAVLISGLFLTLYSARRSEQNLRARFPDRDPRIFDARYRLGKGICISIAICVPLFFLAVGYSKGSIVLDRNANRVTMTSQMILFLPSSSSSVDLDSVTNATLDRKPNSRRIRLEVSRGADLAFPLWSDRAGQQQAVDAINGFLRGR